MELKMTDKEQLAFRKSAVLLTISIILLLSASPIIFFFNRGTPSNAGGNAGWAEASVAITTMAFDGLSMVLIFAGCVCSSLSISFAVKSNHKIFIYLSRITLLLSMGCLVFGLMVFGKMAAPKY
jgi:hypothetical protein